MSRILLGEYGSVAQGTARPDSDHDYMGIYIESEEEVIGLEVAKSSRESDAAQGEKSAPGSSDTTNHSLRKFAKLAAGGNPTVGSILFLPHYEYSTVIGDALVSIQDAFVSRKAGQAYLGYMDAQIKAFAETGRKNRAELVDQYGYDIKFGYHAFRLGRQGVHMMTEGFPHIPLQDKDLNFALAIRAGDVEKEALLVRLERIRETLRESIDNSKLPEYADMTTINRFLVEAHQEHWRNNG